MSWPALILLDLGLLAGWFAIPLGLGGNFILLGLAFVVGFVTDFTAIGPLSLGFILGGVVLGEVLEALLGALMARKYGASRSGMVGTIVGATVGGVLGTMVLPLIGSVIGSFLGSAAGAILAELLHGSRGGAFRAGWGAFIGRSLATAAKMTIGAAIITYIVIRTH